MGHYDDLFTEIYFSLREKKLKDKFYKQLDKLNSKKKHKHKDIRDKWSYAYDKVIKKNKKNGNNN